MECQISKVCVCVGGAVDLDDKRDCMTSLCTACFISAIIIQVHTGNSGEATTIVLVYVYQE